MSNISFKELNEGLANKKYNDVNNPVWMALTASTDDLKDMTEWFREIGLISEEDSVIDIQKITGNVLGDEGRTDMMLTISGKGIINPAVRLMVSDLKWASDFVSNCANDYFAE